jgi:hypothetical protein
MNIENRKLTNKKSMKNLLILLILLANTVIFSQTINNDKNGYYKIIKVDSLSKEQIYDRSKEWIALNYKSANDVIQLDTENKIIVKGVFKIPYLNSEQIYNHSLIFSFKDSRYKVDIILNSMRINLSPKITNIENGYLSTNREEVYKRIISNPLYQEENIKTNFLEEFKKMGLSEKKALKEWEKNKTVMLSIIPKSSNDINLEAITQNIEVIRIKVKNIFDSIEKYIKNNNSNDGW